MGYMDCEYQLKFCEANTHIYVSSVPFHNQGDHVAEDLRAKV